MNRDRRLLDDRVQHGLAGRVVRGGFSAERA
jgi:hypothetical protein